MTIHNLNSTPPSQVRQLFYNSIPFGSEYIIYCKSSSVQTQVYECIVRAPITHSISVYQVSHTSGGDYVFSEVSSSGYDFDSLSVDLPYYSYSSISSMGIRESLPYTNDIIAFMLIVIASLLVLKTVFGGIRLWTNRRRP